MVLLELADANFAGLQIPVEGLAANSFELNGFFFKLFDLLIMLLAFLPDLLAHSDLIFNNFQSTLRTVLYTLLSGTLTLFSHFLNLR